MFMAEHKFKRNIYVIIQDTILMMLMDLDDSYTEFKKMLFI